MTGYRAMQALYVAARLGLADLLQDGARGSEELARAHSVACCARW